MTERGAIGPSTLGTLVACAQLTVIDSPYSAVASCTRAVGRRAQLCGERKGACDEIDDSCEYISHSQRPMHATEECRLRKAKRVCCLSPYARPTASSSSSRMTPPFHRSGERLQRAEVNFGEWGRQRAAGYSRATQGIAALHMKNLRGRGPTTIQRRRKPRHQSPTDALSDDELMLHAVVQP
jgi:hypothetical protein